jgi:hypothetical protein
MVLKVRRQVKGNHHFFAEELPDGENDIQTLLEL